MQRYEALTRQAEQILIDGLPANLKATLARLHARGYSHEAIMNMVGRAVRSAGHQDTCLTALGCGAYLLSLPPALPRGCCGE